VAAVIHGKLPKECRRIGIIVTGGNMEPAQLAGILG
jgi:hypothetical protein